MPRKHLTDLFCARVKPPAVGRAEYFDSAFAGLALRVTSNGHKSFSVHYRMSGRLRRYTLGSFPTLKPAQARSAASAAIELAGKGTDPTALKRERRYTPPPEADTFKAVLESYLARHMSKNTAASTYDEAKRTLERDVLPKWRYRPISSITRREVIALIDGIAARGAEVQANRTQARLRALFNWAVEKGRLDASPIEGMKPPTKERARDRALTDDEIHWMWAACGKVDWPFGPFAKLLLLTAQRRDEVGGMEWSEINLGKRTWTLPRSKVKNDRAHEVQLSDHAITVLKSLPRIGDQFVFTTTGDGPIAGFSRGKARIDAAMVKARRRSLKLPEDDDDYRKAIGLPAGKPLPVEIPHWIFHDLRRTAATGMAGLNIAPHVVDRILNHTSGTIRGVAAVYNRFEYLEERRAALEAWGRFVSKLALPAATNVVELRR